VNYETACHRVCDEIADLLVDLRPSTCAPVFAAASATRNLAAAMHHAAGSPQNARWRAAIESLDRFLAFCDGSARLKGSRALLELRGFVKENADLLPSRSEERELVLAAA
jgi:hypothetical protein